MKSKNRKRSNSPTGFKIVPCNIRKESMEKLQAKMKVLFQENDHSKNIAPLEKKNQKYQTLKSQNKVSNKKEKEVTMQNEIYFKTGQFGNEKTFIRNKTMTPKQKSLSKKVVFHPTEKTSIWDKLLNPNESWKTFQLANEEEAIPDGFDIIPSRLDETDFLKRMKMFQNEKLKKIDKIEKYQVVNSKSQRTNPKINTSNNLTDTLKMRESSMGKYQLSRKLSRGTVLLDQNSREVTDAKLSSTDSHKKRASEIPQKNQKANDTKYDKFRQLRLDTQFKSFKPSVYKKSL